MNKIPMAVFFSVIAVFADVGIDDWFTGGFYGSDAAIVLYPGAARSKDDFVSSTAARRLRNSTYKTYQKYLDSIPGFEGIIYIKFTVNSDGTVFGDTILFSTTENKKFDEEIRVVLRECKWEKAHRGATTVAFPIVFWVLNTIERGPFITDEELKMPCKYKIQENHKRKAELDYILKRLHKSALIILDSVSCTGFLPCDDVAMYGLSRLFLPSLNSQYEMFLESQSSDIGSNGRLILKFTIAENIKTADVDIIDGIDVGSIGLKTVGVDIVYSTTGNAEFDGIVKKNLEGLRWKNRMNGGHTCKLILKFIGKNLKPKER